MQVPDKSTQMHFRFIWLYRPWLQTPNTTEQSSPLYKKYQINLLKCIQNAFLHPNHGFGQKKKSVHLAIPPFAAGYSHSGAEFITAQEPERSSPLHKKYQIDLLKCIQNAFLHT